MGHNLSLVSLRFNNNNTINSTADGRYFTELQSNTTKKESIKMAIIKFVNKFYVIK